MRSSAIYYLVTASVLLIGENVGWRPLAIVGIAYLGIVGIEVAGWSLPDVKSWCR